MIIHGYIPKSKKRKISKVTKLRHEEWLLSISKMTTNFSRSNSKVISKSSSLQSKSYHRETPKYDSLDTGFVACTKTFQKYTGEKMLGIATMHKSNAVPVFTDNEAKEISSMRR
jgi:hypothetical protein